MKDKALLFFCFAMIVLLAFLKLGQHPVFEWDEARNAINAMEMTRKGNWVNLYYAGDPDNWNTKPPLFIWLLVGSYKILGFNELALRLPSALAIVMTFILLFKIITLYRSATFAALTCLLLASVKGLIGWHVGRTGDFDALLTCFLTASVFYFLRLIDFGKNGAAIACGLFVGLAYLTKGPAAAVLLPGMFAYAVLSGGIKKLLHSKATWLGAGIAVTMTAGWYLIEHQFGNTLVGSPTLNEAPKGTAFDRQITVDILRRFTVSVDGWKQPFDFTFIFSSLDKIFNLWHYVFFGFIFSGLILWLKNRSDTWHKLLSKPNRLLLLSFCLYLPLAIFLSIAAKSNRWYLAPALPFVGIITFWGIRHFWQRKTWVKWAFYGLLAFTLGRQFLLFWNVPARPALANNPIFAQAKTIVVGNNLPQDKLCYLYFHGKNMRFGTSELQVGEEAVANANQLPLPMPTNWEKFAEASGCLIFTVKK